MKLELTILSDESVYAALLEDDEGKHWVHISYNGDKLTIPYIQLQGVNEYVDGIMSPPDGELAN